MQLGAFEWDPRKREANLSKHGLDFLDAEAMFSGPVLEAASDYPHERRWVAIGRLNGVKIAIVFSWRQHRRRLISMHRAKRHEREAYRQILGGADTGHGGG
jgi:hypothetical protein